MTLIDEDLTAPVIAAAIDVHRQLGPGLLESAYECCLAFELESRGIDVQRQVPLPLMYKGRPMDCGYRIDLWIPNRLLIEVKAVGALLPIHEAQAITYLKLTGIRIGLLINFNVIVLREGIKRLYCKS